MGLRVYFDLYKADFPNSTGKYLKFSTMGLKVLIKISTLRYFLGSMLHKKKITFKAIFCQNMMHFTPLIKSGS